MMRWITLPGRTPPELPCILLWLCMREAARFCVSEEEFSLGRDRTYETSSLPLLAILLFCFRAFLPMRCRCDTAYVCMALKLPYEFETMVISPVRIPAFCAAESWR